MHVLVLGGGITGLAAHHHLRRLLPDARLTILEREAAPGGKVRTSLRGGFAVEHGPNGFLTSAPETVSLARALGLGERLEPASDAARHRLLYSRGALRPLPTGPGAFLASPLLGPAAKARAALEPFVPPAPGGTEETVHGFLARRFGAATAERLAGALVIGVTAGDARRLSVDALFPRLRALELEHGSVVRGMVASMRAARVARREGGEGGGAERGRLTSFGEGGLSVLIGALADEAGRALRTGAEAVGLEPVPPAPGWRVRVRRADGAEEAFEADAVVLAAPAFASAELLRPLAPAAAAALAAIPYAPVRVLGLGFDRVDVPRPLDGFGFLAPRGEGLRSLGVLWSSSLFPARAPEGKVLLRVLAGGAVDPEMAELDDDAALAAVRRDLRVAMGIVAEPEHVETVLWRRGIPQYEPGHAARVEAAERALEAHPGLVLAGNAYRGVGLNDAVRDARRAAERVAGWARAAGVAGAVRSPA